MNANKELRTLLHKFLKNSKCLYNQSNFEYIGVNIDQKDGSDYVLKVYVLKNLKDLSINEIDNISSFMINRKMIKGIEYIFEPLTNKVRLDFSLKNRINENMEYILNKVKDFTHSDYRFDLVKNVSKIRICEIDNYDYSCLYFFGYKKNVAKSDELDNVNLDFILKKTNNPDLVYANYGDDDIYFSDELKKINNEYINCLLHLYFQIKEKVDCKMWLFALDLNKNEDVKYKLYFRCSDNRVYNELQVLFRTSLGMISKLDELDIVCKENKFLELYGLAIGLNTKLEYSLNFYYKITDFIS